jgi:hypothetical protein
MEGMKHVTRAKASLAIGTLALLALTGWRSNPELLALPDPGSRWMPATELEFQKPITQMNDGLSVSTWPAIGGALMVLLSIVMIQNARARNQRRKSKMRAAIPLVTAMMQLEDSVVIPPARTEAPLPEEFQALITEINEMLPSFEDVA